MNKKLLIYTCALLTSLGLQAMGEKQYVAMDMEFTGLNPDKCKPIEIAAISLDSQFNVKETFHRVVHQSPEVLKNADDWVKENLGAILKECASSQHTEGDIDNQLSEFLQNEYGASENGAFTNPIMVSDVNYLDRVHMKQSFPNAERYLHCYEVLDLNSIELFLCDKLKFKRHEKDNGGHRALDDTRVLVEKIKYYMDMVRKLKNTESNTEQ